MPLIEQLNKIDAAAKIMAFEKALDDLQNDYGTQLSSRRAAVLRGK